MTDNVSLHQAYARGSVQRTIPLLASQRTTSLSDVARILDILLDISCR